MTRRPAVPARGLTLLELLVAVTILSMSLALLYRVGASNLRHLGALRGELAAMALAESLLSARDAVPPSGWQEQGQTAGIAWAVSSVPDGPSPSGAPVPTLHRVQLRLTWSSAGNPRELHLTTLLPVAGVPAGAAP